MKILLKSFLPPQTGGNQYTAQVQHRPATSSNIERQMHLIVQTDFFESQCGTEEKGETIMQHMCCAHVFFYRDFNSIAQWCKKKEKKKKHQPQLHQNDVGLARISLMLKRRSMAHPSTRVLLARRMQCSHRTLDTGSGMRTCLETSPSRLLNCSNSWKGGGQRTGERIQKLTRA